MSCRQNCCSRPKIAICARERAHTFFELYNPNYVGTQLEVLTIKVYIYINFDARTISLHLTCLVDKIAVRGQKLRFARARAHTFFELYNPNYVGTQLEVLTIKIYIYIYIDACRDATEVNQWKSTQDVLHWFTHVHSNNPTKAKARLLQFDICEFYPSISEDLLRKSLLFAKSHTLIEEEEVSLIMACRKSILFNSGNVWTKKDRDFDVTMGAQDGAEIAELTGIYLLKQVNEFLSSLSKSSHAGLYRDDGLIYIEDASGPLISKIEKALHRIFKRNKLNISIEQKGHTINFLDVTLSTDGSYKPYKKPNSTTKYVNKGSNHPPSITKNIPSSIQKRLNTISSCESEFIDAKDEYQRALIDAGYTHELKYDTENTKPAATKKRKRRLLWFNPPHSKSVSTNIGKEFFNLLRIHFPKQHPWHRLFNKTPLNYPIPVPSTWMESSRHITPKSSVSKMIARKKM